MGIFNFFKKKNESGKKAIVLSSQCFKLESSDFEAESNEAKVISVKVSDDFNELFADYITDSPKQAGDLLKPDSYSTKINLWEQSVEVISASEPNQENMEFINQKINWISQNKKLLDMKIVEELLDVKNNSWLAQNQIPLCEEEFLNSIDLHSVHFLDASVVELAYGDGGIFEGHDILLKLNGKNEIVAVSI